MKTKALFFIAALLTAAVGTAVAQDDPATWTNPNSHPTDSIHMPSNGDPCPSADIYQLLGHTSTYRANGNMPGIRPWSSDPNDVGWDTAIMFGESSKPMYVDPYIPVEHFDGYYTVDVIPYNPPMPFDLGYPATPGVTKMQINNDDDFAAAPTTFDFPFYFFGKQKNQFRIGDNGIVTFTTTPMTDNHHNGPFCPYSIHNPIPWADNSSSYTGPGGAYQYFDRTHDAIYGVYEDTYTGSNGQYMSGNQGIYYGVVGEYPCRKIIASWNQIPVYSNSALRQTYQIVCYEGTNMIEVHVFHRNCCPSTSDAIIGIQNATGMPQNPVPGDPSTAYILPNAPAAFWPVGRNIFTSVLDTVAYRFTPHNHPNAASATTALQFWYRKLDDGRIDTLRNINLEPDAANDSSGYFWIGELQQNPAKDNAAIPPNRCSVVMKNTIPSRYYYYLFYYDANGNPYEFVDSVIIGVDKYAEMNLCAKDSAADNRVLRSCAGKLDTLTLSYPTNQSAEVNTRYMVKRISMGDTTTLYSTQEGIINSHLGTNPNDDVIDPVTNTRKRTVIINLPEAEMVQNKIDSVYVQITTDFANHSTNYDTMWIYSWPNFDITLVEGICQNDAYHWDTNTFYYHTNPTQYRIITENTNPAIDTVTLKSAPGCDSTVRLDLTVFDKSYTIDTVTDCQPYLWIDSNYYYVSNNATANGDTILLKNRYGCDSTVQLQFTLLPVVAHIKADRDFFDFDHLDAVLTDMSENNHSRLWEFPNGATSSSITAYYTIGADEDLADIWLKAKATYDGHTCVDSTHVVIPMRKETFWMPNIFTPGRDNENNLFGSISTRTLTEEMSIYNRNGQLVFHCETPDCKWDGRDMNGNPCPQGTYTYLVRYTNEFLPKVTHVLHGTVTLIR